MNNGETPPKLSPRQKQVLDLLLESHHRKHIARQLDISIHTVSGYVKEIYRCYGVRSHVQLLHRFYGKDATTTHVNISASSAKIHPD